MEANGVLMSSEDSSTPGYSAPSRCRPDNPKAEEMEAIIYALGSYKKKTTNLEYAHEGDDLVINVSFRAVQAELCSRDSIQSELADGLVLKLDRSPLAII
jgi:hypothetical protein